MDYFKKLSGLLREERKEDRSIYETLTASTSIYDRRANGLTWYPLANRGTEPSKGDYINVEFERTSYQDINPQFKSGSAVMLFSNHNPKEDRLEGTVTYLSGNKLKINFRTEELPDWADDGKLGIDTLFDDNSYDEMEKALTIAEKRLEAGGKDDRLVKIITGLKKPEFYEQRKVHGLSEHLNTSQQLAITKIIQAEDLAIVHGPPGTGKTTTLVQAIAMQLEQGAKKVLVTAPSNTAVDLLSERLSEKGLKVLRIGNPARISERLESLSLDYQLAQHPANKEIRAFKKRAKEFKDMAHKYKRNFGKAEREQRKALFDEARNIMKSVEKTEQYMMDDLVAKAQIITATLVGSQHYSIAKITYDAVFIDEAGQALEPACWIPILKAPKLVLAGDHQQLPPTIKSREAAKQGLAETLMEKCTRLYPEAVVLLEEQYRMHRSIMHYASQVFYDNKLRAHHTVAEQLLFTGDLPVSFIDTAGCGFEEKIENTAISNPEEAQFLFQHLMQFCLQLVQHFKDKKYPSIAIISPYKAQVQLLKDLLIESQLPGDIKNYITVNTIDSYQGQEREVVYISMTRSNPDSKIGFLSDNRRMNVAMTRAKKKLVVIGDSATLSQFDFYKNFIQYTEAQDSYLSAWEFMEY
ncbi:IGHMBP2 family helicase [Chitinophaga caeni]|uniref:IGHMBP2 family helicase n=1 Tax=Chitinophaga caeni TaxID=2029983 RepID=A0A291QVQ5_9BACT|nr:AAA domain-containing protein [Chitinophaga caeni]ATL48017.1 IGHMBP2 family helicase [Chitinophaga caeni]